MKLTALGQNEQLYAEQVALLYANAPLSYPVTLINAAILVVVERNQVPVKTLLVWFLCLGLVTLGRAFLAYRHTRSFRAEQDSCYWGRSYLIGTLLAGIVWGRRRILVSCGFHRPPSLRGFCAGRYDSGGISVLSARLEAVLAFILPVLLPLATQFFMQQGELQQAMAAMTLLYLIGISAAAWTLFRSTGNALRYAWPIRIWCCVWKARKPRRNN
ncbi:MAG: hypothetical protein R3F37_02000 [Candidatus Competibacteraceae bacterium]